MTFPRHKVAKSTTLLPLGLAMFACGGASTPQEPSDPGPPSWKQSPVVFGLEDPPGTAFATVEDRNPKYVNGNLATPSLSPSRTRMLQVIADPGGNLDGVVQVFPIEENARLLFQRTLPAFFLGWANDEELLFSSRDSETFFLLGLDGTRRDFRFPDDIVRKMGGIMGYVSPDGSAVAFVVSVRSQLDDADDVLVTFDAQTGHELDRWMIPSRPVTFWSNDGAIVLLSSRDLYAVGPGEEGVHGPVPLPFSPCDTSPWVDPGTFHSRELRILGDVGICENSWIVARDGSSAVRRAAAPPIVISPDGRKILFFDDEGLLSMADPDGSNAERFGLFSTAHDFAW
jgi:hypothetical protein